MTLNNRWRHRINRSIAIPGTRVHSTPQRIRRLPKPGNTAIHQSVFTPSGSYHPDKFPELEQLLQSWRRRAHY